MRLLFLMRGNCASGKSTYIEEQGLTPFTLSTDEYRLRMAGLELLPNGLFTISQDKNPAVFKQLKADMEMRMERGLTTVLDATNARASDMGDYLKLAKKYRYRPVVIDFSSVPTDVCKARNAARLPEYKTVSDEVIDKFAERLAQGLPKDFNYKIIDGLKDDFVTEGNKLLFEQTTEVIDGKYDDVVVIGDIHGCYDALAEGLLTAMRLWEQGLTIPMPMTLAENVKNHDNVKFVFIGDYIDRGIQNDKVVDFLYEIRNLPNVKLLMGNHEHNIERSMRGENISRYSETVRTINMIGEERVKKLHEIVRKCGLYYIFELQGEKYLCVHNAISERPCLAMPANTMLKGCGAYESSLEAERMFVGNADMHLIHGHRNVNNDPIASVYAGGYSAYNLCDTVEHGGCLRLILFTVWGGETHQCEYMIKNNVFRKQVELTENVEMVSQLRSSPLIHIKDLGNGISSYNFKREVFFNDKFDALTCKARGLYIYDDGAICARGYDKFFNAWSESQVRGNEKSDREFGDFALADLPNKGIVFPIQASEKSNGYLGLVSYNKLTDDFFIATKSQDYGDYADWFKEIIKPYLTDALKHDLKYLNSTAIFEVIDPERDPHIIRYNRTDVVLLDVVENSFETKFMSEDEFITFACLHNFEHKDIMRWRVRDAQELTALLQDLAKHSQNEGYVIRDAKGFMFKVKTDFYSFWKGLRPALNALQSGKPTSGKNRWNPQQMDVAMWMHNHRDKTMLARSIIDVRDMYLSWLEQHAKEFECQESDD